MKQFPPSPVLCARVHTPATGWGEGSLRKATEENKMIEKILFYTTLLQRNISTEERSVKVSEVRMFLTWAFLQPLLGFLVAPVI